MLVSTHSNGNASAPASHLIGTQYRLVFDKAKPSQLGQVVLPGVTNAHGNLAEQNRIVGPQRGADTSRPEATAGTSVAVATASPATVAKPDNNESKAIVAMLNKNNCTACHGMDKKIVGPGFTEIAKKQAGKVDYLAGKIKAGGVGVWGQIPMPAQALPEADARRIAEWISKGASK